ncbi:trehalose-phosphatase [Mycobacterium sp.]|uniref:trehalose-phosphatase n=1 Tax=Mycobacterium sp. TaxID=1785 RepID=UPI002D284C59|nr:trehalose-phosphatase [Mycobacterium sp.]HZA10606.1 trehalose-phosphatase [Mycobacterium sp.]
MSAQDLPRELRRALTSVARVPRLLVAADFDGTIAPIVDRPDDARPLPESATALRALAGLPSTTSALISGRALRDLATLSRMPAEVHLVGSHGSEFDAGFVHAVDDAAKALLRTIKDALSAIAAEYPGVTIELKPASVALHVRNATPDDAQTALEKAHSAAQSWDAQITEGKAVLEFAVISTDKGQALDILRHREGASAAVFIGDDVTDEKAFRRLHGPDIGIKVGPGETLADYRVESPAQVAEALAYILEERRTWLLGGFATPIERLTMLSNSRTVALLTPEADLVWMCHPYGDSAAVFSRLLAGEEAGHFAVGPQRDALPLSQRYVDGTMTVETSWASLMVTDYLSHDVGPGRTDLIRVISGEAKAVVTFAPRPEFAQAPVRLEVTDEGIQVFATNEPMVLRAPGVHWDVVTDGIHETAYAVIDPSSGPVTLELRCGTEDLSESPVDEDSRRRRAESHWRSWVDRLNLPSRKPGLMKRSALTLRGLVHADTGAIMAAGTTSLPEEIGGVRNWDYRFCWIRDAALTASALVSLGSTAEAEGYLGWLHAVIERMHGPERLQPLYTLKGLQLPPEAVIDSLPGYAGSRPVRVGNAASAQVQLDVFGPVVQLIWDLTHRRKQHGAADPLTDADWNLISDMVFAVASRWVEPDHGIWEIRGNPRHHVYSKVMCWVTVDRAVKLAAEFGRAAPPGWATLRDVISAQVRDKGWSDEVRSYTAAYDGIDLDAATLHIGLSGLIDPSDDRFAATVVATEAELRSGATVYRYHRDDGLPGTEGGFHLCAAWLVEAYLLTGQRSQAEALFDRLVTAAGPTGLLSEEFDPVAERALGNHPQAYSHLGLLRCGQLLGSS